VSVWHDVSGQGPAVVLLHAGLADSRMWEHQVGPFSESHTVVRVDFPGFGHSRIEASPVSLSGSVQKAMDAAAIDRAAIVGVSLGGRAAVELAAESPERVAALVLVGPGIDDHEWSAEVESFGAAEEEALARGDLEAAIETNLQMWLAGPRRTLDAIQPDVRELVAGMQRHAFEAQKEQPDLRLERVDPPASERLGEIDVPTLVITGDEDVGDIHQIADRLMREIPGARRATMPEVAHLPNLERPEEFNRLVLGFLAEHGV
jgi:3-oxoadipate enol-lactonase